jgi:hypothetical protein
MYQSADLLLKLLQDPGASRSFTTADWDRCLCLARQARILGRIYALLDEAGYVSSIHPTLRRQLETAHIVAEQHEQILRWEINRLERALRSMNLPVILLKGAAYVLAGLPPARGRLYSDIDIMVPRDCVALVESALLEQGWESATLAPYDQRYYRKWMHELPPLRHRERHTIVDLHHNILPETGRLHPDPHLLFESALPVADSDFKVLAPADMVLHSAAHMFQDGDLAGSLRDLTDLDDLLRHFGTFADFWEQLVLRGLRLDLRRPLFYALRYVQAFFDTPVPTRTMTSSAIAAPARPILSLMDSLVWRALLPSPPDRTPWATSISRLLLYVRSHWLRMPPLLLARHLLRKSFVRRQ